MGRFRWDGIGDGLFAKAMQQVKYEQNKAKIEFSKKYGADTLPARRMATEYASEFAKAIKEKYQEIFGTDLNIGDKSLVKEIEIHCVLYENGLFEKQTHSVDCGVFDWDRPIWDFLSIF